jgi:hypothetical protein
MLRAEADWERQVSIGYVQEGCGAVPLPNIHYQLLILKSTKSHNYFTVKIT